MLYQDLADRTLRANLSPRYRRIERLEKYVDGTQYDDRPSFWDDSNPLYERAPCVVYAIAGSAARSHVDMCLGEGRWPTITAQASDADGAFDERFGLSEDESDVLSRFIDRIAKQARLRAVCDEAAFTAMTAKTAVLIGCIRKGRLAVESTRAKWCRVKMDGENVVELEVRYPYLEEFWDERAKAWGVRCLLYRRVIDAMTDTTFLPAKASESGDEPDGWTVDTAKTVVHNLGFCPVVWYRFMPKCTSVADLDGTALHEEQLDEIDALNFALSQRHAAAMVAASPPTIELGVEPDHDPAPTGREARIIMFDADDPGRRGGWIGAGGGGRPARRRGPGVIWRYPGAESDVKMLTLPGDALVPVDNDCRDLRSKIAEALRVVFLDPDNAKFSAELSGKAIARLKEPQTRFCDKIREDFGNGCLLRMVDMLLRIALIKGREAPGAIYLPGLAAVLPLLARFEAPVAANDGTVTAQWFSPELELDWGAYFEPDATDEKLTVDTAITAHGAGFITRRTAVQALSEIYAMGNIDEYLDTLDEEKAEATAALHDAQAAMSAGAPPKTAPGDESEEDDAEDDDEAA